MTQTMTQPTPVIEVRGVSKFFGPVVSLRDINMVVLPGQVHCLLGDNGAGKSTLIKVLSGVHAPSEGGVYLEGQPVSFSSPRAALDAGIATVFQDLAMLPLMSIKRNFFMGREPLRKVGPIRFLDHAFSARVAREEMKKMGIDIRDPEQPVGTLSGGERQSIAIARAVYFGAKVLILDEPTSALGVKEAAVVLKYVVQAKLRGLGIIFITHNVHHAWAVGDAFTVLNRGQSYGTFLKADTTREALLGMMAGGAELEELAIELDEIAHVDAGAAAKQEAAAAQSLHNDALHKGAQ